MRVAIVHYWLVGMGGGEKVLEALLGLYPEADIFTHVLDRQAVSPAIARHNISTTFIDRLPGSRRHYPHYLPLMPLALEQLDLTGYDLVISSESGPAKGVITRADSLHVCYCHTPMRYLWDAWPSYMRKGLLTRLAMRLLLPGLRRWDLASSFRVDHFVANSHTVARRIRKHWRRDAAVVHPPVNAQGFTPRAAGAGEHYLCLGRLADYKRIDLAVQACSRLGRPLVVVGTGPQMAALEREAAPCVRFVGRLDDAQVAATLAKSRALLFPAEEDFGIVPLEAAAAGVPCIAYGRGGATETVINGKTGLLFAEQSVQSLMGAIEEFEQAEQQFDPQVLHAHAETFGLERFQREFAAQVGLAAQAAGLGQLIQ